MVWASLPGLHGQADRTLRWLKDALGRRGVPPELFQDLTWHSFRVFIPDCAFQLGISRDQRRYLGKWMTESTADVYTREKRNVVVKVWHEVANNLSEISMGGRMVREGVCPWLNHPHRVKDPSSANLWMMTSQSSLHLRINHRLCWRRTNQVRSRKCLYYRRKWTARYQARHQRTNWALLTAPFGCWTPANKLGPPHGPLRVVASSRKSGPTGTYKIHLLTVDHKAVGCGWQPTALKAQDLNPIERQSDPGSYQECVRCFKLYDFPSDWPVKQTAQEEDSEISSSSADSFTDDSVDTASESEKVTASDLRTSIPNDPL